MLSVLLVAAIWGYLCFIITRQTAQADEAVAALVALGAYGAIVLVAPFLTDDSKPASDDASFSRVVVGVAGAVGASLAARLNRESRKEGSDEGD